MFSISLSSPGGSTWLPPSPLAWTVERMSWRAVGGPWTARLRADAPRLNTLWQLAEGLGYGLTLFDAREAAWWGYLSAVELHAQGQVVRLSLEGMANQVAVAYHERTPNAWAGPRQQSAWAADSGSIARYGAKQRVFALDSAGADAASAAAYAATLLRRYAGPQITTLAGAGTELYAVVEARGWWERLDWRFYSDPRGLEGHQSGGSVAVGVGGQPAAARVAQSFRLATAEGWTADEVWLKLRRNHAADTLLLEVRDGESSAPGETCLARASLPAAQISEELAWTRFALDAPVALQPGRTAWLVLSRSGAIDPDGFVQVAADEDAGYPRGDLRLWNGSAWTARAPDADLHFQALGGEETSAQAAHLLGEADCLRGARIETPSGIQSRVYRDGTRRARAEIEALLQGGTASGQRLLARVTPERVAVVYAQPAGEQAALALSPGGQITRLDGRILAPSEQPAGQWARLGALTAPGAAPNLLFIESCAWDGRGIHLSRD